MLKKLGFSRTMARCTPDISRLPLGSAALQKMRDPGIIVRDARQHGCDRQGIDFSDKSRARMRAHLKPH
jgi:hypothetical protein